MTVSFRLRPNEEQILNTLTQRGGSCGSNPSEFFRSLLWREAIRRGVPGTDGIQHPPQTVYSEMRIGRPKNTPTL